MATPGVLGAIVVVLATAVAVLVATATGSRRHVPVVLLVGALALVVTATTLPTAWSLAHPGRELVLVPGNGGLRRAAMEWVWGRPTTGFFLLVLNALLYLPLGVALRVRWPARAAMLLVAVAVSVAVEATQYVALERVAATDDVIVNVAGALLGWAIAPWLLRQGARWAPRSHDATPAATTGDRHGT